MSKEKINNIIVAVSKLKSSANIVGILGDKTDAILSNEVVAIHSLLTKPQSGRVAQDLQMSQINCSPESWVSVITSIIQIGLTVSPFQKHVAIVPYGQTATAQVMTAGLKHLLFVNNIVKKIDTNAVCENDKFEMIQPLLPQTITTNFRFEKSKSNRGKVVSAYAFLVLTNGEFVGDYLSTEEIAKRKNAAKTKFIWDAWEYEMAEKTALAYVAKNIPSFADFSFASKLAEMEEMHHDLDQQKTLPESKLQQLPTLSPDAKIWTGIKDSVEKAMNKGSIFTIEDVRAKYQITEEHFNLLMK